MEAPERDGPSPMTQGYRLPPPSMHRQGRGQGIHVTALPGPQQPRSGHALHLTGPCSIQEGKCVFQGTPIFDNIILIGKREVMMSINMSDWGPWHCTCQPILHTPKATLLANQPQIVKSMCTWPSHHKTGHRPPRP